MAQMYEIPYVFTESYLEIGRFYFYSSKSLMGCISLTQCQMTLLLNVMPMSETELKNSGKNCRHNVR